MVVGVGWVFGLEDVLVEAGVGVVAGVEVEVWGVEEVEEEVVVAGVGQVEFVVREVGQRRKEGV